MARNCICREVLAPACSWWRAYLTGAAHAFLVVLLTVGFGAWLFGDL
jgi:hypothetical protein